ncbi:hypothetical protein OESDEN_21211 [Oesophagostomum dentatum]|uniref:Uncharacterized protein n=1 Tax=Oesophagostomum dentatum TaxID=61180 RepID=A0A0B1S7J6_OESDE|nr:hypothetical protein OESDEN_21211 [Oesophagostomum dentatum]
MNAAVGMVQKLDEALSNRTGIMNNTQLSCEEKDEALLNLTTTLPKPHGLLGSLYLLAIYKNNKAGGLLNEEF